MQVVNSVDSIACRCYTANIGKQISRMHSIQTSHSRLLKIMFMFSFVLHSLIIKGLLNSQLDYEVSLYTNSDYIYVFTLIIILVTFGSVSLILKNGSLNKIALIGTAITAFSLIMLPAIRGYTFYGHGDSPTHLGYLIDGLSNPLALFELQYPILHTQSLVALIVTDLPTGYSLYLVSLFYIPLFIISCIIICNSVQSYKPSLTHSLLVALLFLPIIHVGTGNPVPQPAAQAAFYFLFVTYGIIELISRRRFSWYILSIIAIVTLILLHPLRGVNLLVNLLGLSTIALILSLTKNPFTNGSVRTLTYITIITIITLHIWIWDNVASSIRVLLIRFLSTDVDGSQNLSQTGDIFSEISATYLEFVLKLVSPHILLSCSISILIIHYLRNSQIVTIRSASLIIMFLTSSIVFVSSFVAGVMPFRNLIIVFVLLTPVGAISVEYLYLNYPTQHAVSIGLALLLIVSILVVHPSPYIYTSNPQHVQQDLQGLETGVEYRAEGIYFSDVGTHIQRTQHMVYGYEKSVEMRLIDADGYSLPMYATVPDGFGSDISEEYPAGQYIYITNRDRIHHTETVEQYRFSQDDFESIEYDNNVVKYYSNGHSQFYGVNLQGR